MTDAERAAAQAAINMRQPDTLAPVRAGSDGIRAILRAIADVKQALRSID